MTTIPESTHKPTSARSCFSEPFPCLCYWSCFLEDNHLRRAVDFSALPVSSLGGPIYRRAINRPNPSPLNGDWFSFLHRYCPFMILLSTTGLQLRQGYPRFGFGPPLHVDGVVMPSTPAKCFQLLPPLSHLSQHSISPSLLLDRSRHDDTSKEPLYIWNVRRVKQLIVRSVSA